MVSLLLGCTHKIGDKKAWMHSLFGRVVTLDSIGMSMECQTPPRRLTLVVSALVLKDILYLTALLVQNLYMIGVFAGLSQKHHTVP